MRILNLLIIVSVFSSCKKKHETLEPSQKIKLEYQAWACECANWALPEDSENQKDLEVLAEKSVFVEPAERNLKLPDTIGYAGDLVEFEGNFYLGKRYPKDYVKTKQEVRKAKVFRFINFKIIRSNHHLITKQLKTAHRSGLVQKH